MTHNRPFAKSGTDHAALAQPGRSISAGVQPVHVDLDVARYQLLVLCLGAKIARINERATALSGPGDKCGGNHSYAFLPDVAVNRRRGKRRLPNDFESENAGVGVCVLAFVVFYSSSDADSL